ncbi:MAG: hypothetical protein R3242_09900 [Akkermansiaceae bacterium]|nr:hypothetical protein [Akkermansiaceae bacterium]
MDFESDSSELVPDLVDAVEQQLASPQTGYVNQTLKRLTKAGLDEDEAKHQIAWCLGKTLDRMASSQRGFDERFYQERLGELPLKTESED